MKNRAVTNLSYILSDYDNFHNNISINIIIIITINVTRFTVAAYVLL